MQIQNQKQSVTAKDSDPGAPKKQAALQFRDKRPEAEIQRKLQEQGNVSPGSEQLKAVQLMAASSSLSAPIQMKTDIKYDAPQKFTFGEQTDYVGSKAEATLDPKDPIVGSDTGGAEQDDLMDALPTSTTWKKGHLLNHDLGGRAIVWNLFPITTAANSEHYHEVEKIVKHWIGNGKEASYTVTAKADDAADKTNANGRFECEAKVLNTKEGEDFHGHHINKTIYSHVPEKQWDRYYSKKGKKGQKGFGSVGYNGDENQVARDQYGRITTLTDWENQSGNQELNRIDKDKSKGVSYANEKGKLKIEEIDPEVLKEDKEEEGQKEENNKELSTRSGDREIFSGEHDQEAIEESVLEGAPQNVYALIETTPVRFANAMCQVVTVFYEAGLVEYNGALTTHDQQNKLFYQQQLEMNYKLLLSSIIKAEKAISKAKSFLEEEHAQSAGMAEAIQILFSYYNSMQIKEKHLAKLVGLFK